VPSAVAAGLLVVEREGGRHLLTHLIADVVRSRSLLPRRQEYLRHLRRESSSVCRRHDVLRIGSWRRHGDAVDADALTEAARRWVAVDPDEAEASPGR
jgi:hypothetical protein